MRWSWPTPGGSRSGLRGRCDEKSGAGSGRRSGWQWPLSCRSDRGKTPGGAAPRGSGGAARGGADWETSGPRKSREDAIEAAPGPSAPWRSRPALPRHMLVPLVVACALFMENMDSTVIATSLPAIAADLHQDPITLKLAMTSYLISLAVFIPASGWAADRFGARPIFRGAIVVFVAGSILCGLADTPADLRGGARDPGARRRHDGAGGPARPAPLGPARGARDGPGLPDRAGAARAHPRPAARRVHHHLFRLALDLLDQRARSASWASCWRRCSSPTSARPRSGRSTSRGFLLSGAGLSSLSFGLTVIGRGIVPSAGHGRADRRRPRARRRLCASTRGGRAIPSSISRCCASRPSGRA